MLGLEKLDQETAKDFIELVNSLKKLSKNGKVSYRVQDKKTNKWADKSYSYVLLDTILEKIKENNNFAFIQPICVDEKTGKKGIKCILIHKSGKSFISDLYEIKSDGSRIQGEGAEITYRKRYSAGAFLGVATEEDIDGGDIEIIQSDSQNDEITSEQLEIISNLTPDLKENIRNHYKKDPITLTKIEAEDCINKMLEKGLIKTKKQEELERKRMEDVF